MNEVKEKHNSASISQDNKRVEMSVIKKCFLCGTGEEDLIPVILFKSETLEKCLYALKVRIHRGLQYCDVVLPKEVNDTTGYHLKPCYKNFTTLKQSQKVEFPDALKKYAVIYFICRHCLNLSA